VDCPGLQLVAGCRARAAEAEQTVRALLVPCGPFQSKWQQRTPQALFEAVRAVARRHGIEILAYGSGRTVAIAYLRRRGCLWREVGAQQMMDTAVLA